MVGVLKKSVLCRREPGVMTRGEDEDLCGGLELSVSFQDSKLVSQYILIWPAGGCGAASLLAPLLWVMQLEAKPSNGMPYIKANKYKRKKINYVYLGDTSDFSWL